MKYKALIVFIFVQILSLGMVRAEEAEVSSNSSEVEIVLYREAEEVPDILVQLRLLQEMFVDKVYEDLFLPEMFGDEGYGEFDTLEGWIKMLNLCGWRSDEYEFEVTEDSVKCYILAYDYLALTAYYDYEEAWNGLDDAELWESVQQTMIKEATVSLAFPVYDSDDELLYMYTELGRCVASGV